MDFLQKNYRVIAFDHRGQGLSETPIGSELITPEDNYLDTVELLETLQLGKVHFIGLAMGGFVGMRLGARNSHLLKSLVLMGTDSFQVNSGKLQNEIYAFIINYFGPQTFLSESIWPGLFDKEYIEKNLQLWVDFDKFNLKNNIYRTVKGLLQRAEFKELNKIQNFPVIVIHGENDVIPISSAQYLVNNIKDAQFLPISNAGHFTPIEKPTEINQSILKFAKAV